MTVYTGATTGDIVASYDTPDDGDNITAASVNVALHGLTDDMGRVNQRGFLSGRNNVGGLAFANNVGSGVLARSYLETSGGISGFTALNVTSYDLFEFSFFDGTGGNTRTFSALFDAAAEGQRLRVGVRNNSSNSGNFTIQNGLSSGGNEVIAVLTPSTTLYVWCDFIFLPESTGTILSVAGHSAGVLPGPSAYGTVP